MKASALFFLCCVWFACPLNAQSSSECQLGVDVEYTKQIRAYTTEPFFSTELVDHLPSSSCVPSPEKFLHHIIGAPNVLDHVDQINAYMRLLEKSTPRVRVFSIGRSEEGREMLAVMVSDAENIRDLDRFKQITARLADPRSLTDQEVERLIAEGKPIYWADGSIHSPETGAPEMLMELAYRLAVDDTPFIQKIRKDSIVMITPVVEPDGRDREVDIYMHHVKHPQDPRYPLVWWGHYVAHDNNRDSLGYTLALSRNMLKTFLEWHPTVMHDLHESVPYLYIMTGTGPYNAWLDPIVISEWQKMAYHEIEEMTKRGVIGVWTHGFYDGWAPNYLLSIANGHNAIGRFYETFGNGGADTQVRKLNPPDTNREWYRPNPPLAEVKWSARDNINMQESAILLGMNNLATHKDEFLNNFYMKGKRAFAKAQTEGPAAWVFPADDPRPAEQARFLSLLAMQGIEISRLGNEAQVAAGARKDAPEADAATKNVPAKSTDKEPKKEANKPVTLPKGSYVIRMDQPYSRLADMVLDTQYYNPTDPRSYDDTGWTLGALRNIKTIRVMDTALLSQPMQTVPAIQLVGSITGTGSTYLINHNTDNTLATFRYRLADVSMEAAEAPFETDGVKFNAGTFILRAADRTKVETAAKELGLSVHATASAPRVAAHPLQAPRVAIIHNWMNTQNDGWYRSAFEELQIPYAYVADTKLRQTDHLREKFDVMILPPLGFGGASLSSMVQGVPMRGEALPWKNTAEMPNLFAPGLDETDDMRGGLGYTGLANIEQFVREGGLLIAAQSSSGLPIAAGLTQMVNIQTPPGLNAPGSVLLSTIDDSKSPITYGYGDKLYVYFHDGPVFNVGIQRPLETNTRSSGRGSATDPDVIQARAYREPEKPPKRSPREQELDIPEEVRLFNSLLLPPAGEMPRVALRFAPEKELVLSGMLVGGNNVAEKPVVVDVPHGKGHVVLFANNPMWRGETMGSFFLVFNAMFNYDHLDAGRSAPAGSNRQDQGKAGEQ